MIMNSGRPWGLRLRSMSQLALGLAATLALTGNASAQEDYPSKPITMLISFSVTGSSGHVGRMISEKMEEKLGQPIELVGHKPGKGGNIAAEVAKAAAPDGYTIFMGTIGNISILPNILKGYPVDPLADLIPLTQITDTPDVLIATPSAPFDTFDEFVAYAKAHPGEIRYSNINGASIHAAEFSSIIGATGIEMTLDETIRGSANAMKATADGTIDVTMTTVPYILPYLREGKVKALALASEVPSPQLPDLELFTELGVPSVPRGSWNGLFVPAGTPQPIVDKLFDAIHYGATHPDVKAEIEEMGMRVSLQDSPAAFHDFIEAELARFKVVAEEGNIVVE